VASRKARILPAALPLPAADRSLLIAAIESAEDAALPHSMADMRQARNSTSFARFYDPRYAYHALARTVRANTSVRITDQSP
jgi:hypothetical protein